jgi:hypothetical protein
MRTVFEILPSSLDHASCTLLCELSNEGFSFCIKDDDSNSFSALGVYHFDKNKPAVGLPIALQIVFHQKEILCGKFKKVCVIYSFSQSAFVPFSVYDREKNEVLMNMMFGDLSGNETILTDVLTDKSLYNCYRVPSSLVEVIQNQFPDACAMHQYSLLLKNPASENDQLTLIFYTYKFVVCLVKDGKYKLVNSFHFETPEDVSYSLLNICQRFKMEDPPLIIHGLLEESSPLYKDIYKYFSDIQLAPLPSRHAYSEEISKFPSHYFSYIFAIDSCE